MAQQEEDNAGGVPEWVVTFGDMMSLLLTFFIMLVSLSEIKNEEKYQALVESMRRQFGHDTATSSIAPGPQIPRNSAMSKLASQGRAMRANTMEGGDRVKASRGEHPKVRTLRKANRTVIGAVVYFGDDSAALTDDAKAELQRSALQMLGKPQKIEVRGHTSLRPLPPDGPFADQWALSYARCRAVQEFLEELSIDPRRIRLSQAAQYEPYTLEVSPEALRQNERVEVHMLDELITDHQGSPDERASRYRAD